MGTWLRYLFYLYWKHTRNDMLNMGVLYPPKTLFYSMPMTPPTTRAWPMPSSSPTWARLCSLIVGGRPDQWIFTALTIDPPQLPIRYRITAADLCFSKATNCCYQVPFSSSGCREASNATWRPSGARWSAVKLVPRDRERRRSVVTKQPCCREQPLRDRLRERMDNSSRPSDEQYINI